MVLTAHPYQASREPSSKETPCGVPCSTDSGHNLSSATFQPGVAENRCLPPLWARTGHLSHSPTHTNHCGGSDNTGHYTVIHRVLLEKPFLRANPPREIPKLYLTEAKDFPAVEGLPAA